MDWNAPTSDAEAARRAGGRRHYNRRRQRAAMSRLGDIVAIMVRNRWCGHEWGIRSQIARELGVSRATIARDFQYLARALMSESYADEWLIAYRWWRRNYGDSFGERPGRKWPQMDRKGPVPTAGPRGG